MIKRNTSLRLGGVAAMATAGYHAYEGDRIIKGIEMSQDNMDFVSGTFQLGTMGWIAAGALLIGAATLADQKARNLIVVVVSVLLGFPALGTLMLTGGEISIGGAALATAVAFALYGRKQDRPDASSGTPQDDMIELGSEVRV